ncbi:serine acetyltransferase [Photobacterium sagamiensis]|uniref:serine O-acetyltransferase n=1 Tax=Photobacterium sagamiensis TaxID=2910241 RepID=UPI003D129004
MILYRIGNNLHRKGIPIIPKLINLLIRLIHNSAVYCETNIGNGTKLGYGGIAVVIHKRTVIGQNCVIGSGVTIGGRSRSLKVPVIGDNVYIATGAKVLGDIKIGNNCVVGANAVVINDVPNNTMVVGVPAKIVKTDIISKDYY